jgi:hypothetical protein
VKSASVVDCGEFDLAPFVEDALPATEVDIGRGEIVEALMVTMVVVVIDEGRDGPFEVSRGHCHAAREVAVPLVAR